MLMARFVAAAEPTLRSTKSGEASTDKLRLAADAPVVTWDSSPALPEHWPSPAQAAGSRPETESGSNPLFALARGSSKR